MLELLSPAGLWALAALSLPLAIHLWRPPPRTVRLGSLRFLENLPRRVRDLRWRDRLLLAARLGLLTLLALLLAGLRWRHAPPHGAQRWIFLDPNALPSGGSLDRLNALRSTGYELRTLASSAAPDLWSLLREADAELPAGSSVAVFSPGRLASLCGSRPALRHGRVEWVQTPDAPEIIAPRETKPAPPPLEVLILHDADRAVEGRALAAAVRAAGRANVRIEVSHPDPGEVADAAWVFWLSAQAVPSAWTARGANVFSEAAGDAERSEASWIVQGASSFIDPARLWRRTAAMAGPPGAVWWTDGFGQPLLTRTREGRGWHWRLFGRLDPAWTDLTHGGAFPAALRELMFAPDDPVPDRRVADPSQCRPAQTPPFGRDITLSRAGDDAVDLHGACWTLAAVLFGLERWGSHRRRRPSAVTDPPPLEPAAALSR